MYDDKRELTRSVIEKRKQRTSREEMKDAVKIVKQLACGVVYEDAQGNEVYHKFRYKVGEVVAVALNLKAGNIYIRTAKYHKGLFYGFGYDAGMRCSLLNKLWHYFFAVIIEKIRLALPVKLAKRIKLEK